MARLVGFGVQGFRDIRERAYLGPWAKVNIIGGANNAGKSALLRALDMYLRPSGDGRLGNRYAATLAELDIPDSEPHSALSFGYAVDFGEDLGSGLVSSAVGKPATAASPVAGLDELLNLPVFLPPSTKPEGNIRWLWLGEAGETLSNETWDAISIRQDQNAILQRITSQGYSGTVSWGAVVTRAVVNVEAPTGVVYVPANRQVVATDHRGTALPGTTGAGLPGMLLTLLAPPADKFYSARDRLRKINTFLAAVLDRSTAQLLVPHNADTVHVALEDRVRPLSHLGAGIEQAVLLATICTEYNNHVVLIEEPDLYMHPTLQRQFLRHLHNDDTGNTYIVTTHSAALLDTDWANVFRVDWSQKQGTVLSLVSEPGDRARLATSLGFRASDLVQANAVIWVEGPSDRIYVKHWLELADDAEIEDHPGRERLVEGVHFSFVMYGGRLGQHLAAGEAPTLVRERSDDSIPDADRLVRISRINRHAIFLMDSDLTDSGAGLAAYKSRLRDEIEGSGEGLVWITAGVMIENYLDPQVYKQAYGTVHPRTSLPYDGALHSDPFAGGVKQPAKVRIAEAVVQSTTELPNRGDLLTQIETVRNYLHGVNGFR